MLTEGAITLLREGTRNMPTGWEPVIQVIDLHRFISEWRFDTVGIPNICITISDANNYCTAVVDCKTVDRASVSLLNDIREGTILRIKQWNIVRTPRLPTIVIHEFEILPYLGCRIGHPTEIDRPLINSAKQSVPGSEVLSGSVRVTASHLDLLEEIRSSLTSLSPETPVSTQDLREHKYQLSQLCQGLNNLISPIYKLPPEISSEIIHLAIIEEEAEENPWYWDTRRKRYQILVSYAAVSSLWLSLVLSTPKLWAKINIVQTVQSHEIVSTLLQRSGSVPLDIEASCPSEETMRLLIPHISRWRSFAGSLSDISKSEEYFGRKSAPLLRSFKVTSMKGSEPYVSDLFNNSAERLRYLILPSITLSWDSPLLSSLIHLDIIDNDTKGGPTPTQHYELLKRCLGLEVLRIRKSVRSPDTRSLAMTPDPIGTPVELAKLKRISFEDTTPAITARILSSIMVSAQNSKMLPSLKFYNHSNQLRRRDFQILGELHPETLLPCIILSLVGVKITFNSAVRVGSQTHCNVEGSVLRPMNKPNLIMNFLGPSVPLLSDLCALLIPGHSGMYSKVRVLHIEGPPSSTDRDLTHKLSCLPNLEELILSKSMADRIVPPRIENSFRLGAVCDVLGLVAFNNDHQGIPTVPNWHCPKLKVLRIHEVGFRVEALLDMVELRYGINPNTADIALPASIELLEIKEDKMANTDMEVLYRVKSIVETKGKFIWNPYTSNAPLVKW